LFAVAAGISAAGVTLKLLPKTICKSAISECLNPSFNSFSGRFSPKLMIES